MGRVWGERGEGKREGESKKEGRGKERLIKVWTVSIRLTGNCSIAVHVCDL